MALICIYTVWRVTLMYYYCYDDRAAVLRAEREAQAVAYEAKARERHAKEQRELTELENKRRAVEQVCTVMGYIYIYIYIYIYVHTCVGRVCMLSCSVCMVACALP
jgi:uncharacterized membrane protein